MIRRQVILSAAYTESRGYRMADFIRARSAEHKEQRLAEVKEAAAALFAERPYHEITLSTIAEQLSWSRANLYKYVRTKEEIFLSLSEDARDAYYDAVLDAFSDEAGAPLPAPLSATDAAAAWADAIVAHEEWFRYLDLLFTIIESNVSHERLVVFKRAYYELLPRLQAVLGAAWGVPGDRVGHIMNEVGYQGTGIIANFCGTPQVVAALKELGITVERPDVRAEMAEFIKMLLDHERVRVEERGR